jgi:MFS family permease
MFLFEIPTGAIADIFGRKVSVGLAYTILGLGYIGMILSGTNLILLFILNFITGIAWTMESGAFEAWFVDTIKHKKKEKHLHRYLGRWGSATNIGFIIGPFLGGILVSFGYEIALFTTAIAMILLGLTILIFGKEYYFKRKKIHMRKDFKRTINNAKEAISYAKNHPTIFLFTIIAFLATTGGTLTYNAFQPHLVNLGLNPSYIGYALSIGGILLAIQLNWSHKIKNILGSNKKMLLTYGIFFGLITITLGLVKTAILGFIIMIIYTAFHDLGSRESPAYREITNKAIPSKIRASVLSVIGWSAALGMIIGNSSFGFLSDIFGANYIVVAGGTILTISALLYFKLK